MRNTSQGGNWLEQRLCWVGFRWGCGVVLGSSPFCFLGQWGLGLCVECEMLQRRAIVLQCFVLLYKKEEINTHFLIHTHGSPPPLPQLDPAGGGTAMQASRIHQLPGEGMKTPHSVLSSQAP